MPEEHPVTDLGENYEEKVNSVFDRMAQEAKDSVQST